MPAVTSHAALAERTVRAGGSWTSAGLVVVVGHSVLALSAGVPPAPWALATGGAMAAVGLLLRLYRPASRA
jgi:hypothetical protein